MKLSNLLVGAAVAALFAVPVGAQAANLLVNGDFESTDNGYSPTITPVGWTNIGHIDGVIPYSMFSTPAYDGNYYYDEGGYGDPNNAPGDGIEQTVATTPGQTYTLTFGLSSENGMDTEIADVTIGGVLTQYTLGIDGAYAVLAKPFTTYSITYTADSALTIIAFTTDAASEGFGYNDPMIDGISFDGATGGVPEPATWAMMLAGFAGIGSAMRMARTNRKLSAAHG